jgi:hypothetical protein
MRITNCQRPFIGSKPAEAVLQTLRIALVRNTAMAQHDWNAADRRNMGGYKRATHSREMQSALSNYSMRPNY